tara:strand:+ start:1739 stop:1900 length:162 start_codon:yes stop_codon:yes gene_type:complete
MKQQFVSVVINANDDRPKAEGWLKAAIENDLKSGESIFEFKETNLDSNGNEVE